MYRLKVSEWGKIHYVNINHKEAKAAILLLDKVELRARNMAREKEGHFIVTKRVSSLRRHKIPKCVYAL